MNEKTPDLKAEEKAAKAAAKKEAKKTADAERRLYGTLEQRMQWYLEVKSFAPWSEELHDLYMAVGTCLLCEHGYPSENMSYQDFVRTHAQEVIDTAETVTQEQMREGRIWRHARKVDRDLPYEHQLEQEQKAKQRQADEEEARQFAASPAFLQTEAWQRLRFAILKRDGRRCAACGATPEDGTTMHVDHIKPRQKYPELALEEDNLQVLCRPCDYGKGLQDTTDFRPPEVTPAEVKEHIRHINKATTYDGRQERILALKHHQLQAIVQHFIHNQDH